MFISSVYFYILYFQPSRIPTFVRGNRKTSTPIAKTKIRNEIEQLEISTKDEETSEGCGVINVFHQDCTSAQGAYTSFCLSWLLIN